MPLKKGRSKRVAALRADRVLRIFFTNELSQNDDKIEEENADKEGEELTLEALRARFGNLETDEQLIAFSTYQPEVSDANQDSLKANMLKTYLENLPNSEQIKSQVRFHHAVGALPSYIFDSRTLDNETLGLAVDVAKILGHLAIQGEVLVIPGLDGKEKGRVSGLQSLRDFMTSVREGKGMEEWNGELMGALKRGLARVMKREAREALVGGMLKTNSYWATI